MKVTTVGYTEYHCPIFMVETGDSSFSIQKFATHSYSEAPMLIVRDEVAYVYQFTLVRRTGDMIREWDGGKMEPFACLSDEDCNTLLQITDSTAEQSVKNQRVQEILERNRLMEFGSGS